jgi:hypothetical protein
LGDANFPPFRTCNPALECFNSRLMMKNLNAHLESKETTGRFAGIIRLAGGCLLVALVVGGLTAAVWVRAADAKAAAQSALVGGKVVETMDSGGYTYVQVDSGKGKIWAAGPKTQVKVGDQVTFADGVPMRNYQSKTLNRTFESIYFVSGIYLPGQSGAPANPHAAMGGNPHAGMGGIPQAGKGMAAVTDFSGLKKPADGLTVAEIFAQKETLAAKKVTLRGKVVKYNAQILGKNWIHVRDGTGAAGSNDLLVTSAKTARVGDTVLVVGTLVLNQDFGSGYKYDLLLEEAEVTVEPPAKP